MKVCDSWLKAWTNSALNTQQMIEKFTMAGLEVDECAPAAPLFSGVVVAEVVETQKHPQADKLTVCQINNGDEIVQVVCGAKNVRTGLKVALAKPGAILPNDMKITEAKLRGELSLGMLCSPSELGCADDSEGIWELPKDAPVGQDFRQFLNLDEHIFSFELTPNRGDCFSARGLARELSAITGSTFSEVTIKPIAPKHDEAQTIKVVQPQWCPSYCGRRIKNIKPHTPSPLWLRESMRRIGLRSIHPIVDVLNYVMYFLGQPMHAFDVHKIGTCIEVKDADGGEKLTLLNGKQVELITGTPVITNGEKVIAIAGVMGSEESAVDEDTSDIFLESAFFQPIKLSGVARQYGLSTDASMRYERGVDPSLAPFALEFATQLLIDIVGGEPGPVEMVQDDIHMPTQRLVHLPENLFTKRTGVELSKDQMLDFLNRLGFEVNPFANHFEVKVPSHRFDIQDDVDLVEEMLRLFGYENIPSVAIVAPLTPGVIDPLETSQRLWSNGLNHLGYQEVINYAFVDPKIQNLLLESNDAIALLNPISPELSQMRKTLWTGLLSSLIHNLNHQQTTMQLFECGVVFEGTAQQPAEETFVAGLIYGDINQVNWITKGHMFDFYDAKGHIEHLLARMGYEDIVFDAVQQYALHPGQTARISVMNQACGLVGSLHPKIQHELGLLHTPVLWQINLSKLVQAPKKRYHSLSKFPHTRRDISFVIDRQFSAQAIVNAIYRAVPDGHLKQVDIFDIYHGAELPENCISMAVACIFQDLHKTLVEQDILSFQGAILKVLSEEFGIKLRDGQ